MPDLMNREEVMPDMEKLNMYRRPVHRVDLSINMEKTGANIKRLIKASGYTVRDIMEITGLSTEQAVYKWFRGDSIPSLEAQLILCKVLDLDITELLVIDGEFHFYGKGPVRPASSASVQDFCC